MSKKSIILIVIIIFICAGLITAGTYLIKRDTVTWSCPYVSAPQAELSLASARQSWRGFPERFYKNAVSSSCDTEHFGLNVQLDIYRKSEFRRSAVVQDFAFWGIASAAMVTVIAVFRGRGKK